MGRGDIKQTATTIGARLALFTDGSGREEAISNNNLSLANNLRPPPMDVYERLRTNKGNAIRSHLLARPPQPLFELWLLLLLLLLLV
jgi:hypothetical protein